MQKIGRAAWLCLGLFATAVQAGDFYIGADLGLNSLADSDNSSPAAPGPSPGFSLFPGVGFAGEDIVPVVRYGSEHSQGGMLGINAGLRLDNGFRPELGLHYRTNDYDSLTLQQGFGSQNGTSVTASGDRKSLSAIINLWYDFATGSPWHPYVGGGAGLSKTETLLTVGGLRGVDGDDRTFAYQLGAGIGYAVSDAVTVSLDYRFLDAGEPQYDSVARPVTSEYVAHTLSFGIRYGFVPPAPTDADHDGVTDTADKCTETPVGTLVDSDGCPPPPPPPPEPAPIPEPVSPPVAVPTPAPLPEPPPAPVPPEVPATISFELNSATLTADAEQALETVAKNMAAAPLFNLIVAGHASDEGTDRYNLKLSTARATAIKDFLTSRGIEAGRIQTEAFGESRPVVPNIDDSSRSLNRRVELKVPELPPAPAQPAPAETPVPPATPEPPPPALQPAQPAPDLQPV